MRISMIAAALPLLLFAGCSDEVKVDKRAAEAKQMLAGDYEVVTRVTRLDSADKTKPATRLKIGDTSTTHGCVSANGTPDTKLFIDPGDKCSTGNSYFSGAIINAQLACTRAANPGNVSFGVDGSFTADSFKAHVITRTSFAGSGDYVMERELTARRTGNCAPATAKR